MILEKITILRFNVPYSNGKIYFFGDEKKVLKKGEESVIYADDGFKEIAAKRGLLYDPKQKTVIRAVKYDKVLADLFIEDEFLCDWISSQEDIKEDVRCIEDYMLPSFGYFNNFYSSLYPTKIAFVDYAAWLTSSSTGFSTGFFSSASMASYGW